VELGVLFCDQVGSTDLLTRLGDALAEEIRRDLFEALYRAAELCRGEVVKSSGDGLMVVFPTGADDALDCGYLMVAMVNRLARRQLWSDVQFKVGVSHGDAVFDQGDWYGASVNLAARLCAAAAPSQVLAATATVVASRHERSQWVDLPAMALKGFPEAAPVRARQVDPAEVPDRAVPVELDLLGARPLAGRQSTLDQLWAEWDAARNGQSNVVSVLGAPGMGVSRTLAELAESVTRSGLGEPALVLSARSDTGARWASQLIRSNAAAAELDDLRADAGPDAAALTAICPLVGLRLSVAPQPALATMEDDLVTRFLARLTTRAPVLIVLDGVDGPTESWLQRILPPRSCLAVTGARLDHLGTESPSSIVLDELGQADIATLLAPVLSDLDAEGRSEVGELALLETNGVPRDVMAVLDQLIRAAAEAELTRPTALDAVRRAVPYKGLQVFSGDDAVRFYGRSHAVAEVLRVLDDRSFIVVVGSSGSGKSSVVRAGCLPRLADQGIDIVVFAPGEDPVRALAGAWCNAFGGDPDQLVNQLRLSPSGLAAVAVDLHRPVVMVIDQLEECFTLCADEGERDLFFQAVTEPISGLRVLATLRGDFYGRASEHAAMAAVLQSGTVVMTPPTHDELRTVIEAPATAAHLRLEPGLSDLILTDITDRPGGLPLLSHALSATWLRRHGGTLAIADYRAAGGATGAIARTADTVFDQLSTSEQGIAKRIFLRLTALGEGVEDSRRRVPLDVLLASGTDGSAKVLDTLTAARLVTAGTDAEGTDIDELAHEALLREWPRLRDWLDEDRDELRAMAHLETAARDWDAAGRGESELYAGRRLDAAEGISADKLNDLERVYLSTSLGHREAQHRKARRATRRLQALVIVLVVLLVAASVAGIVAGAEYGHVKAQQSVNGRADRALLARSLIQDSQTAAASGATDRAVLFDVQAARFAAQAGGLVPASEVQAALITGLQANPHVATYLGGLSGPIEDVAVSPDGRFAAAITQSGRIGVWQLSDDHLLTTFAGFAGPLSLAFLGNDTLVTLISGSVAAYRGSAGLTSWKQLWDVQLAGAASMASSRSRLYVGTNAGALDSISLSGHLSVTQISFNVGDQIADSPDGSMVAVDDPDWTNGFLPRLGVTPGGADPGNASVLDLYSSNGALKREFVTSQGEATSIVAFSANESELGLVTQATPDDTNATGGTLAPASQILHQFNIATGMESDKPVATGSESSWAPVALSPSLNDVIESGAPDGFSMLITRDTLGVANVLTGSFTSNLDAPAATYDMPFPYDGSRGFTPVFLPGTSTFIASGGLDSVPVFNVSGSHPGAGRTISESAQGGVSALSPDGHLLVNIGPNSLLIHTLSSTPRTVAVTLGSSATTVASDLSFGAASSTVAVGYANGSVEIRSTSNGRLLLRLEAPGSCPNQLGCAGTVSMSGTLASGTITSTFGNRLRIWNLRNDKVEGERVEVDACCLYEDATLSESGTRLTALTSNSINPTYSIQTFRLTSRGWIESRTLAVPSGASFRPSGCPCLAENSLGTDLALENSNTLSLWDLGTGKRLWTTTAPLGTVWFGADDKVIYRSNFSGGIDEVSVSNGRVLFSLPFDTSMRTATNIMDRAGGVTVASVTSAADSTSLPQVIQLSSWGTDVSGLVRQACAVANRNLTSAEWSTDVGSLYPYERTCPVVRFGKS
jgi:class 3 adenylate cyclase/WD40 repeat protein